jgi:hypothetical protein
MKLLTFSNKGKSGMNYFFLELNLPLSSRMWITKKDFDKLKLKDTQNLSDVEFELVIDWMDENTKMLCRECFSQWSSETF